LPFKYSSYQVATAIAIFFHAIGLVGLLYFDKAFFIAATPMNLLLSFGLLIWTARETKASFYIFLLACFVVGIAVEMIGVHTGLLFGEYHYGAVLGYGVNGIPLLIGVNWFIVIYCCGTGISMFFRKLSDGIAFPDERKAKRLRSLSVIIDGATLAVFFDWLMEPVAVKLGYWTWLGDGSIPFYNYICWFGVSVVLLSVFRFGNFNKHNKFALNLLLVQLMFFLILRTFMQ
jgi:bisanhydrobacterioruberin hydratase